MPITLRDAMRLQRVGGLRQRIDRVHVRRELALGRTRRRAAPCWPDGLAGSRSMNAPQNTPTMSQPFSSARLSGSFGISPAAKPITRKRPCPGDRAQRRLRVGTADRIVDHVGALAAGDAPQPVLQVFARVVDGLVGAVLRGRTRACRPTTRRRSRARPSACRSRSPRARCRPRRRAPPASRRT